MKDCIANTSQTRPSRWYFLWDWCVFLLKVAREQRNWRVGILREIGPCLVLLGLGAALPEQGRLAALHGGPFGFLVGMGASWTVVFGFSHMPLGWRRWLRFLGMGALVALILLGIGDMASWVHDDLLGLGRSGAWGGAPRTVLGFLAACFITVLMALLFDRIERHRREAERQRLLAEESRDAALRTRLAPHFIFNALNTLHAQIDADPKGAQATTERLAELFRQLLEFSSQATIPLRRELAFIEAYLGIEQARLGDRLRVAIEIPEDLETAELPPLSLQVLVENAIKHGVAPLERGGEVRLGASRGQHALHVWVEDPGLGFSSQKGTGTALETLRQRLVRPEDLEMGMVGGRHRVGFRWGQP
ncbi:MAG TPA: histidine kinase [Geothrix sp.]|nr:histidine kinase [Geothrix sp.]